MDAAGNFVIVWQGKDVSQDGIFAQRYDSTGATVGNEFQVNVTAANAQVTPALAMDSAGNFVVSWTSNEDGSGYGIYAQRYNATGVAQGSESFVQGSEPSRISASFRVSASS